MFNYKTLVKATGFLLLTCFSIAVNAQSEKEVRAVLEKFTSEEEIDALKAKHPNWDMNMDITLSNENFPTVVNAKPGDIVKKQYYSYSPVYLMKVLSVGEEELCKVNYIFLDGKELSRPTIDSIRAVIVEKYNSGQSFEKLAKEYNMDAGDGKMDWFPKGRLIGEFDAAARLHKKGDIFTIDVDSMGWYYVAFKPEDNKMGKSVKAFAIALKK